MPQQGGHNHSHRHPRNSRRNSTSSIMINWKKIKIIIIKELSALRKFTSQWSVEDAETSHIQTPNDGSPRSSLTQQQIDAGKRGKQQQILRLCVSGGVRGPV